MATDSCERCGATAPEALLRTVELYVDGSEVDEQTICPDCFADWIAHYQEQMAGDMPGSDDSGAATEKGVDDDVLSEAVRAAQKQNETDESAGDTVADTAVDSVSESDGSGGNEIREVGDSAATPTDDGDIEIDLNGGGDVDDADEDSDGLILD